MTDDPYKRVKTDVLCDMSVTAGAGAGKTTSLKDRYVRIITEGGEKGHGFSAADITAVTFTRKASIEMKERITHEIIKRLNACLKDGDENGARFYKEMKDELQYADISTIHSLCTKILREHPHEADVDPDFTILDEKRDILLEEVIVECIQNDLTGEAPCSPRLIHSYGFGGTVEVVKNLFGNPYLTEKVFDDYDNEKDHADDETSAVYRLTVKDMRDFYNKVKERYEAAKKERSSLDFNDLELITKRVLETNEKLRRLYINKIKFLMVDEFQDTNPIQKEIIYLLVSRSHGSERQAAQKAGGKRPLLFIVGDPKQSIYRFRNADVEIFKRVKDDLGKENSVYLQKNYRSHKKIVDFINVFFDMYMTGGENDFETSFEPLIHVRDDKAKGEPVARVKCLFFDEKALTRQKGSAAKPVTKDIAKPLMEEVREFEAKVIAQKIHDLVEGGAKIVYEDENTLRAARYGDILILFSALTSVELYTRELKKRGIPFCISSGVPFYKRPWIYDLMNLLKTADNPHDDVALCGMLRSPFVLLSDAALFVISLANGDNFYKKVLNAAKDEGLLSRLDKCDQDRLFFAVKMLKEMKNLRSRLKISEFIHHFMEMTGYLLVMASKSDGEIIEKNVKDFINFADSADMEAGFGVKEFIEYVRLLQKLEVKQSMAAGREDENKVRIMSIHASKGLEGNIVIVPDISRKMNQIKGRVLMAKGHPPGIKVKLEGETQLKESVYEIKRGRKRKESGGV